MNWHITIVNLFRTSSVQSRDVKRPSGYVNTSAIYGDQGHYHVDILSFGLLGLAAAFRASDSSMFDFVYVINLHNLLLLLMRHAIKHVTLGKDHCQTSWYFTLRNYVAVFQQSLYRSKRVAFHCSATKPEHILFA